MNSNRAVSLSASQSRRAHASVVRESKTDEAKVSEPQGRARTMGYRSVTSSAVTGYENKSQSSPRGASDKSDHPQAPVPTNCNSIMVYRQI